MVEIIVNADFDGIRLDKVVHKVLPEAGKGFVQKMYRKKNIVLNDKKCTGKESVIVGDSVKFYFSDETFNKFAGSKDQEADSSDRDISGLIESQILYEDDDLLVYNKQADLLSQPNGRDHHLIQDYEAYMSQKGYDQGVLTSYGVCNRLDRNTTGVILIGKNAKSLRIINNMIMAKDTAKVYHTVLYGNLKDSIELKGYLVKKSNRNKVRISLDGPGDFIHTIAKPIGYSRDQRFTLAEVQILTGKSHQIRAHLSSAGYPVVGDGKYGDKIINDYFRKTFNLRYHLLHSRSFRLGDIDELPGISGAQFEADYFELFENVLKELF